MSGRVLLLALLALSLHVLLGRIETWYMVEPIGLGGGNVYCLSIVWPSVFYHR